VPWLFSLLNQFGEPQWRSRLGLAEIVNQTLKTLPLGETIVWDFAGRGWIVWVVLAALPFLVLARHPRQLARPAAVLLWLAVPIAASYLISFVSPIYAPRYLIVIAPALYLLIAVGVERVSRRFWPATPLALAVLAATAAPVLNAAYTLPLKEDYRSAAQFLRERARPDDAVVIMAGYLEYAFIYYGVDGETPLGDVSAAEQVPPALAPIADGHRRVWFVQSHYEIVDPGRHAERWLLERCQKVDVFGVTGIRLTELACSAPANKP
jgi:hypothetical protein